MNKESTFESGTAITRIVPFEKSLTSLNLMSVEELNAELLMWEKQIEFAQAQVRICEKIIGEKNCPFKIGQRIFRMRKPFKKPEFCEEFEVVSIEYYGIEAHPIKKNGTPSHRIVPINTFNLKQFLPR